MIFVNSMALNYVTLGKEFQETKSKELKVQMEFLFTDIVEHFQSMIDSKANKAVFKASNIKASIPKDDFVSAYFNALMQAVREYNGASNLEQRFNFFAQRREADVFRSYGVRIDGEMLYSKARNLSLDEPSNEEGDSTNGDMYLIDHATNSAEDEALGENLISYALTEFFKVNEKFAGIIDRLMNGSPTEEIVEFLGEVENNGRVRTTVSRARKSFANYLNKLIA